jgi:hypothetical protein
VNDASNDIDDGRALIPASPASVSVSGESRQDLPTIERFEDLDRDTVLSIIEGADRHSKVAKWTFMGGAGAYVLTTLVGMVAGWPGWISPAVGGLYSLFALSYVIAVRRGYTNEARTLGVSVPVVKRLVKEAQRVGRGMALNTVESARMGKLADRLMELVANERRVQGVARLSESADAAVREAQD